MTIRVQIQICSSRSPARSLSEKVTGCAGQGMKELLKLMGVREEAEGCEYTSRSDVDGRLSLSSGNNIHRRSARHNSPLSSPCRDENGGKPRRVGVTTT